MSAYTAIQQRSDFRFKGLAWRAKESRSLDMIIDSMLSNLSHSPNTIPEDALSCYGLYSSFPRKEVHKRLFHYAGSENTRIANNAIAWLIASAACKKAPMKKVKALIAKLDDDEVFNILRISNPWDGYSGLNLLEIFLGTNVYRTSGFKFPLAMELLLTGATPSRFKRIAKEPLYMHLKSRTRPEHRALDVAFVNHRFDVVKSQFQEQANAFDMLREAISAHFNESVDATIRPTEFYACVFEACDYGVPLSDELVHCLSVDGEVINVARYKFRTTALKSNNLTLIKQMRESGWFDFSREKQDRGFTFAKNISQEVAAFSAQCFIEDFTFDGIVDVDGMMKTLASMPKGASVLMPELIARLGDDVFWSNVSSISVVKKALLNSGVEPIDVLSKVKSDAIKMKLMPMVMG